MSQGLKRLEAMRNNPRGDWTIDDVKVICRNFGLTCTPPARGSHYDVSHPSRPEILTVPANRPVKQAYIRQLIAFVDAVRSETHDRS